MYEPPAPGKTAEPAGTETTGARPPAEPYRGPDRAVPPDGDTAETIQELVARFVRAFGLHQPERTPCGQPMPVSEAHAVAELGRDGPLRQVELGRRLRLEKSTVSRLVGQLVERGWAVRDAAHEDGRGVTVRLTDAGRAAAARVGEARRQRYAALLDRIPPARRAEVLRALRTLAEAADD
jgi:DNA-binding MarR family transcriptional regulator